MGKRTGAVRIFCILFSKGESECNREPGASPQQEPLFFLQPAGERKDERKLQRASVLKSSRAYLEFKKLWKLLDFQF